MTSEDTLSSEQKFRLAIEKTHALVADALKAGFDTQQGDWAQGLADNQASLLSALNTPATPGQVTVRLIEPETWWMSNIDGHQLYTSSPFQKELWEQEGRTVEKVTIEAKHDGFLHRLIENTFSWAMKDCNYLNPRYMDRLIAETVTGMNPEQAAKWNASAPVTPTHNRRS